jgi:uncharacterized lipoprotein YmbA
LIGPIELPKYLDRPQIVTRTSRNELQLAEFNQWAEPLKDNISRVLADNLSILLSTDRIAIFPRKRFSPIEYQVAIEVIQFEGDPGRNATLTASWTIFGEDRKQVLLMKKSSFSESTDGPGYEALVSAKSRALGKLSQEIAEAIQAISEKVTDQ